MVAGTHPFCSVSLKFEGLKKLQNKNNITKMLALVIFLTFRFFPDTDHLGNVYHLTAFSQVIVELHLNFMV